MTDKEQKMAELGALIKLKVKQEKYAEAEELSAELLAVAESSSDDIDALTTMEKDPATSVLGALAVTAANEQIFRDREHLKLLALFHTVVGAGTALFSSMFLLHVFMGVAMLTNPHFMGGSSGTAPREAAIVFIAIGSAAVLTGWIFGALQYYSGRCIAARKHCGFSSVVAAISSFNIPLGTVLGVFTLIVLNRPSVKELYNQSQTSLHLPSKPGATGRS